MSVENQPEKRKSPLRMLLLIAVIIVALASIVALVYVVANYNGAETSTTLTTSTITMTDNSVTPSVVTVKSGDSVTWVNNGSSAHSLEITSPNVPQELEGFGGDEPILQDESYSFIFEAVGTFTYDDPSNPGQIQGTIIVEE